jgi:beta-lactamase regulating signal transducer with metallopeptidase domain
MNAAGSAIAWCAVQIALVGAATVIAYWLAVKLHPAAGGLVATAGLAVVFCLSAAAASPWPRWGFLDEQPTENDTDRQRRWSKIPIVGALAKSLLGKTEAPRPATGTAAAGTAVKVAVAPQARTSGAEETLTEERPARSLFHALPGAFPLRPKPRTEGWRWSGSLAVMFALGLAAGGARMLLALLAAHGLRRRSRPLRDARMLELLESLKVELGAVRPIELRHSAALSAPATIGWRRPVILLPAQWRSWTERERRAVLAHEIAHVERGDYLLWLAAQMAMTLHFYHPAVHWLVARIRLEQEFAADAVAATVAGGRRAYLATLAKLTLQAASPAAVPLSFVSNRGMLLERIERLRRLDEHPPALTRWGSKTVAIAILLLAGTVASGLRGAADESRGPGSGVLPNVGFQAAPRTPACGAMANATFDGSAQNDAAAWPGRRAPG